MARKKTSVGGGGGCVSVRKTPVECGRLGGEATGAIIAESPDLSNLPNISGNVTDAFAAAARENGVLGGWWSWH